MNEERRELGDLAAELARKLVQERFPDGPMTLEEMEEALAQVKRELGERLQKAWIERQEPEGENRAACVRCGDRARFCGVRGRLLVSRHGEMNVRRRYYHCPHCHQGFAPLDLRLRLDGHATSPQVRAWVAELASDGAFALAVQRLATFTDVRVSESTAARIAQRISSSALSSVRSTIAAFLASVAVQ